MNNVRSTPRFASQTNQCTTSNFTLYQSKTKLKQLLYGTPHTIKYAN